jgi:hypothetical protein
MILIGNYPGVSLPCTEHAIEVRICYYPALMGYEVRLLNDAELLRPQIVRISQGEPMAGLIKVDSMELPLLSQEEEGILGANAINILGL